MSSKRATPKDVQVAMNPMGFPDPLYVITCRAAGVAYGYPPSDPPRYYDGSKDWPMPPYEEPEIEPWVPWADRDQPDWDPDIQWPEDPQAAADVTNWAGSWEDDGGTTWERRPEDGYGTDPSPDDPRGASAPDGIKTIKPHDGHGYRVPCPECGFTYGHQKLCTRRYGGPL